MEDLEIQINDAAYWAWTTLIVGLVTMELVTSDESWFKYLEEEEERFYLWRP